MTTSNYITFILLGVIGLVFLIDFILNSRKKPLEKSVEKFVEKEKSEGKSNLKWLNWILDRKKNITISILVISLFKLLIHFLFYRSKFFYFIEESVISLEDLKNAKGDADADDPLNFAFHLEYIFLCEVWLFIPVTIIYLIIVWFFNDKIKAR